MSTRTTTTTTVSLKEQAIRLQAARKNLLPLTEAVNKPNEAQESASAIALLSAGGYVQPGLPQFVDLYKKRRWQLEHLACAFRVFARKGYTEGTAGHISIRDAVYPHTFWINP